MFIQKYYYLFLLVPLFFAKCFSFIHVIERTISSFDDKPNYSNNIKSCNNCKHFIENENVDFSRCSKFIKQKKKQQKYNFHYIKTDGNNKYDLLNCFYLASTCRNNETLCGINAKYYQRKYHDIY
jgi:hypothetical protein